MKIHSRTLLAARSLHVTAFFGSVILGAAACDNCERRPYIPNTSEVGVSRVDAGPIRFAPSDASFGVAPPDTTEWEIGGLKIASPVGSQIVAALVGDHTGDGSPDAWVVLGDAEDRNKRSLAFVEGGKWSSPVSLPEASGCDGEGGRRVQLRSLDTGEPSGSDASDVPAKVRPMLLTLPVTCAIASETSVWWPPQGRPLSRAWSHSAIDPVGIESTLELGFSGTEGTEEIRLRLRRRNTELVYRFVKRGNEWARDLREPEESLVKRTSKLLAGKEAGNSLRDLEELALSVCGASGAIYGIQGRETLPCLSEGSLNALRLAQGKAFLKAKDVAAAVLSLARLSGKDGEKKWLTFEKTLRAELPTVLDGQARAYAQAADVSAGLLPPGDTPWMNEEKTRVLARVQCTRLGSFAQWYDVEGDAGTPVATSLRNVRLPLRTCANDLTLQATYLGRSKTSVDLLVDGRFVSVSDALESNAAESNAAPVRQKGVNGEGSACAPSGSYCVVPLALPTYSGFLVFGKTTRMLRLASFPKVEALRCTVNDVGTSVACRLQDGSISVFDWRL